MKTLKIITAKDRTLLKGLARTGVTTREQAKSYCKVGNRRLDQLERAKLIKKEIEIVKGQAITVVRLDRKGKVWVKENTIIENCYRSNKWQTEHDLKLSEFYYRLPEDIKDKWLTEQDIVSKYEPDEVKEIEKSVDNGYLRLDAGLETENGVIGIESTGSSYTQSVINAKINYAKSCGIATIYKF
jgi:hypothetical protein